MKQEIIDNPDQWIITRQRDFVRIKDSEIQVDKKLEAIREHLKIPFQGKVRFKSKTDEQISKERYDKVWEEVNFDTEKLHDWIYDERNKDKVEIVKLEEQELKEVTESIFNHAKNSKQKWRTRMIIKPDKFLSRVLINEETGQIIYGGYGGVISDLEKLDDKQPYNKKILIPSPEISKPKEKHTSTLIFLHGTYGAGSLNQMTEKFPGLKVIHPHSPTLQYDMWHGLSEAPGGQCKGWINITGDAWELMEADVPKAYNLYNPSRPKNFEEADKIIHLDYHQLMRAVNYVNEIIEREIEAGIPPEKVFISGYSQGGLLTLAVALTSAHKLGGFIPLCGLLPRWDKLLVKPSEKNKETPCLIINNSGDPWVPFWTGKKSYDLLKERGYNVEFKTHPGLGHDWKNKDIEQFFEKCSQKQKNISQIPKPANFLKIMIYTFGIILVIVLIGISINKLKRKRTKLKLRK